MSTTKIHNNTSFSLETIAKLIEIGKTVNKWRGRNITLFYHPDNVEKVISVGVTFDGKMTVIAEEYKAEWATALDYIDNGKVYVSP